MPPLKRKPTLGHGPRLNRYRHSRPDAARPEPQNLTGHARQGATGEGAGRARSRVSPVCVCSHSAGRCPCIRRALSLAPELRLSPARTPPAARNTRAVHGLGRWRLSPRLSAELAGHGNHNCPVCEIGKVSTSDGCDDRLRRSPHASQMAQSIAVPSLQLGSFAEPHGKNRAAGHSRRIRLLSTPQEPRPHHGRRSSRCLRPSRREPSHGQPTTPLDRKLTP